MGHERVGTLPKTQKWRTLVGQIADFSAPDTTTTAPDIAGHTIQNVHSQFRNAHNDPGIHAAFEFLIILAVAARSEDPRGMLLEAGIEVPDDPTALSFAKAASIWIAENQNSLEYGKIARGAASDAIASWHYKNRTTQVKLFEFTDNSFEVWRKASNGAGFCELARIFFASFTERYLSYFLEREASAVLPNIGDRDLLGRQVEDHVDAISQHAFETARITQSFAAGWFNNHARETVPDQEAIRGFLWLAFGKIREELLREGSKE